MLLMKCVAVCCSVLQCVSVLQFVVPAMLLEVYYSVVHCATLCCAVLRCVSQCVAVYCCVLCQ